MRLPALLLVLLACLPAAAQDIAGDRTATERRLQELQAQIARDEARLAETSEAEEATLKTLQALDRQITLREELVRNYQIRLEELRHERDSLQASLAGLETAIAGLRSEYRQRATHAYKYGRLHDLALILAAESINQMLIRVRYLHRFAEQRRRQLATIREASAEMEQQRLALQEKVEHTDLLLRAAADEQQKLARQKQQRRRVAEELRKQRLSLEASLQEKKTLASQLATRIQALIAEEAARRRTSGSAAGAAFVRLSGSFLQNKGNLPWPAAGPVVEPFGEKVHPVYGTTTPNPGIVIATPPMAEVRAVFDGTVISIDVMPDIGRYMIVEHGQYHSVYGNFALINVGEGEQVRAGQLLGRSGTDAEPKGEGLFFGLFHDGRPVDPLAWLARR
ncbi:peptidoglycan DD-metalloendopeptidase family protein [Rhodocaloribacter litoris]|uniref:murein hydrolase activator EnvC family protein n=1 Tax=Rhodocaloribacter litoris TaxID=2558931 RepID=UPI001421527F|nr:peptidoglycan DD-metalloendopeptidase family protein [Rhodocaloribacter litoris]QXD14723.1 peptidoglycan DD-metalloendopeptidase family protein [Rhodocaloribacter litoris]